jgi:hypothetical protein
MSKNHRAQKSGPNDFKRGGESFRENKKHEASHVENKPLPQKIKILREYVPRHGPYTTQGIATNYKTHYLASVSPIPKGAHNI